MDAHEPTACRTLVLLLSSACVCVPAVLVYLHLSTVSMNIIVEEGFRREMTVPCRSAGQPGRRGCQ